MIMMPMGDEDFDSDEMNKNHHGGHPLSKAEQRRSNKPIMEKKRRARINHCLNELKSLILDAMKKDPARHSKLEKADILEMTVKHLQTVQRQQLAVAVATDPAVLHKFKSGFNECAGEVSRYIGRLDGVELAVKQRLVSHLANCVTGLHQLSPFGFAAAGMYGDTNNNADLQTRLPAVGPTSSSTFYSPSSSTGIGTHSSAFTAVARGAETLVKSPMASPVSSIASSEDSDYMISASRRYPYGEAFKVPLRAAEHASPPQHQVVSSTVVSQEQSPPQAYAQVKLEFKPLPSRTLQVQQPLSVVTSQAYGMKGVRDPLDFSLKARQCAVAATQTTGKRSYGGAFDSSDTISSSIVSPDKVARFDGGGAFCFEAARGARGEGEASTSQEDKDMWRPW